MFNIAVRDLDGVGDLFGESAKPASQHNADCGSRLGAIANGSNRCARQINIPAMQADIKFAIVPAATAFRPSRAKSDFRLGASAPIPPI